MAPFILHRQLTVEWGQCDPAGIVFNSRFFEMFDISTWMLFESALGVTAHQLAPVSLNGPRPGTRRSTGDGRSVCLDIEPREERLGRLQPASFARVRSP